MEESKKDNIIYDELLNISMAILSSLGIKQEYTNGVNLSAKEAIKKLYEFKVIYIDGDEDLNHFFYFIKQFFLDIDGNIDLDLNELSKIIPRQFIDDIFKSLIDKLKAKQFFRFIFSLGEIFTNLYFRDEIQEEILYKFEHKGLNSVEVFLKLISRCKKNKNTKFFYMNYDMYFFRNYFYEIRSKFIFTLDLYFDLCLSSSNYNDEIKKGEDNNSKTTIDSERKNEIPFLKDSILKNLKLYWCNSYFISKSTSLGNFMNFLYIFFTQKTSKIKILNNFDKISKNYLSFISYQLQNLFTSYDDNSFMEFKKKFE